MSALKVQNNTMTFGSASITFERTLRIPDDGKTYPLPPSFGHFPIHKVDDYLDKVPAEWRSHGGVFIPMYQREAMWVKFGGNSAQPKACKIAIGKVNAISGKPWSQHFIYGAEQDYLVIPDQPWLDGINAGNGVIKQFVAMPLGGGYTVEAQVTGKEDVGGMQVIVFEPKPNRIKPPPPKVFKSVSSAKKWPKDMEPSHFSDDCDELADDQWSADSFSVSEKKKKKSENSFSAKQSFAAPSGQVRKRAAPEAKEMGLAAGGKMKQSIYKDKYGIDTWDENNFARVFVHIVNSTMYRQITGIAPPVTPIDASAYTNFGYPWFDVYDEHIPSVPQSGILSQVKSVSQIDVQKYGYAQQNNSTVHISGHQVKTIPKEQVRDGDW